jgi:O-antigen/teichoic acid export membrane protein
MAKREVGTNFLINVLGATLPLLVSLITVPVYIRHIGDSRYGVLMLVWVLLGYFGFLDFGMSRAAANALARLRNGPQQARSSIFVTALILNLALGLIGMLCLAIAGNYLLPLVMTIPELLRPEVAPALPWIAALIPLALVSGVGVGALESQERFLAANVIQVVGMSLGNIIPMIFAVSVSPSLAIVIPAAASVRALTTGVVLVAAYRQERPLSIAMFDLHHAKELLSYGGWITVSAVISPILVSLDQFVIGSVLNVAAVTHYAVPMNLVKRTQLFAWSLTRTLFPRMSRTTGDDARNLASRTLTALAYGYAAICAPGIVCSRFFFQYWIGPDFAATAAPVTTVLFLGIWINGLALIPYTLLQGQGRPDVTAKLHAAEMLPFIGVLWYLTQTFQITGAAIAWSLRASVDAGCLFIAAGIPIRVLRKSLLLPLLILGGSIALSHAIETNSWQAPGAALATAIVGGTIAVLKVEDLRLGAMTLAARVLLGAPRTLPN